MEAVATQAVATEAAPILSEEGDIDNVTALDRILPWCPTPCTIQFHPNTDQTFIKAAGGVIAVPGFAPLFVIRVLPQDGEPIVGSGNKLRQAAEQLVVLLQARKDKEEREEKEKA